MGRVPRIGLVLFALLALVVAGYTAYVGYEASRVLVHQPGTDLDCRTPDVQFGWTYEAINYDIADDAELRARNPDLTDCAYQGVEAGDEVVTDDGIRIAGWYIPAANGADASAPTIVLVHGFMTSKSGILPYGRGLHDEYNLVAWDMRNVGRSTGEESTGGVLEQRDLRAVIDWLERTKHPTHIAVLGNSLGAVTALAEARDDARVEALVLDSMHTRIGHQIAARVEHGGYPSYFGTTWAIETGIWIRTGADVASVDAERTIAAYGKRPLLVVHGTLDNEDLPERTQAFFDRALDLGVPAQLEWCEGAGHNAPAGMPVAACASAFDSWMHTFFGSVFGQ